MAPFKYEPFQNPYVGSIIDLMGKGDEAKAQALLRVGEIEAQAARQRGQVWGGAIQGAGNIAAKGIQDWQQEKIDKPLREQAAQLSGFQLDDAKRAARQQQSLNEGRQFLGGIRAGVDPRDPDYLPGPNGEAQKYPGPSDHRPRLRPNGEEYRGLTEEQEAVLAANEALSPPPGALNALIDVTIKAREESLGRAVTLDEERYTRQQVMDRNHALFVATQEGQLTPAQVESALAITRSIESSSNYTDMTNIGNGWSTLKAVYPMEHTGASDIAMINAFQRIIDPGATVREGDTVLLQSGAAFKDRYSVEFAQVKLGKGAKLPPELRENLYQLGRTIYAGRLENYEHTEGRRVSALAKASGLPLELLIGGGFPPAPSQNAIRDIE
jgi:hypothetical protein